MAKGQKVTGDVGTKLILEGDQIDGVCTDGRADIHAAVQPGVTAYVAKGGTEIARNVGRTRYHEIIIELK